MQKSMILSTCSTRNLLSNTSRTREANSSVTSDDPGIKSNNYTCVVIAPIALVADVYVVAANWPNGLLGSGGHVQHAWPDPPEGVNEKLLGAPLASSSGQSSGINRRSVGRRQITTEISFSSIEALIELYRRKRVADSAKYVCMYEDLREKEQSRAR